MSPSSLRAVTSSLQCTPCKSQRASSLSVPECGEKQHCRRDSLLAVDHNEAVSVLRRFEDDISRVVDAEVVPLASHHVLAGDDKQMTSKFLSHLEPLPDCLLVPAVSPL